MKKKAYIAALAATVTISVVSGTCNINANAEAAYDTDYTKTYTFETLIKPALTNPYTDENGIYRQLEQSFRYRVMTQGEVLDLYDTGYKIPVNVLKKLYKNGYIGSYVYHRAAGLPITPKDLERIFNADYYYNAYPDLQAAIGYNPQMLFNHFVTVGMTEGRRGSINFDPVYYKNTNPDIAAEIGDFWYSYYINYILHAVEQKRAGSPEDEATRVDRLDIPKHK
ncbi:hypothetical protein [Butyrivibrio sp. NC3005]|uniref:hypothetical protein n=1 Tax=Butyrivibrio sp. NC3005 TaxID=1280685 RepID=UPI000401BEA4|nr:hypothetical protein [Butyrivibrio sp. NC3005]